MRRPFRQSWNPGSKPTRIVAPVVYFLKRNGRVIYIGSTVCIAERMANHFQHPADEVEYFHTASEQEARIVEKMLIRLFMPKGNVVVPGYGQMHDKSNAPKCVIERLFTSRFPATKGKVLT